MNDSIYIVIIIINNVNEATKIMIDLNVVVHFVFFIKQKLYITKLVN
jgi:hypothetical protein